MCFVNDTLRTRKTRYWWSTTNARPHILSSSPTMATQFISWIDPIYLIIKLGNRVLSERAGNGGEDCPGNRRIRR
ncbi:hypothetical protein V6Z12_A11G041500 [Gossypium hirsutum]